ncbi:fluoride efflux transporter CrcB [Sphingomonas sp. IW22]|uniref:fluoride efflux transporter CrcB n=1 Tax=Sphingomonas sp. IW22 TaxID=3242489 RepID=UPI003522EF3F
MAYILVMLGGAIGSAARFAVGRIAMGLMGPNWPWGTLAVNLIGGLAMGLLAGSLARIGDGGEHVRLLIGVGALGGFTTFSAFTLELVTMLERGDLFIGFGYALLSVVGAAVALFGGLLMMRAMP